MVVRDELTYGIFGKDRFGWWAWVSSSHLVLSADSELVLTTLQQLRHPVLHLRMDCLCVAANPPGGRNARVNLLATETDVHILVCSLTN